MIALFKDSKGLGSPRLFFSDFFTLNYPRHVYGILSVLLLISAFLAAVALVSPGYPWLSFTTLIPLFVAIRVLNPAQAGVTGGLWALAVGLFSQALGNKPIAVSPESFVLLGAVPGAYAASAAWLTRRYGFNPFILGLGWLLTDWALSPIGAQTGFLTSLQRDDFVMTTLGQSLGYLVITYLIAMVNAIILTVTTQLVPTVRGAYPCCPSHVRSVKRVWRNEDVLLSLCFRSALQPRAPPQLNREAQHSDFERRLRLSTVLEQREVLNRMGSLLDNRDYSNG